MPIEILAQTLQVAFDAGAKRIRLSIGSLAGIATILGALFAKFQTSYYADPVNEVFEALGEQQEVRHGY